MAIDVFISCSTRDRDVAEAIGRALEATGVTFWSPLELKPDQAAAAPDRFRLVVLVFSARANKSRRIIKEIEYALARQMPIVTLCIDEAPPRPPFDQLAASEYWRYGRRASLPEHLEQLTYWVTMLLARLDMGSRAQTINSTQFRRRAGRTRPQAVTPPTRRQGDTPANRA